MKKQRKIDLWIERSLMNAPYLALCLTKAQFVEVLNDLDESLDVAMFSSESSNAVTHTFEHKTDDLACVVAIRDWEGRDSVEVAGLLVHEAVHVFQKLCASIGERNPSAEFEAYSIQTIAQRLMQSFVVLSRSGG